MTFELATGCTPNRAVLWLSPITLAMGEFSIGTPERQAAFLAQVGHESVGFACVRELWGPTTAQMSYEGRYDLGNTRQGDGYRYRGRGLIQITGRANYCACGEALCVDLESQPQLLEGESLAARSAAWFWKTHGLNELADAGDYLAITKRINGGTNGWEDRLAKWDQAKKALRV